MRQLRLIIPLILSLTLASLSKAQSTTVSGTIQDSGGQLWFNGTYSFTSQALGQTPITGSLSSIGTYTQAIPHTQATALVGDVWIVSVCPAFAYGCFNSNPITITGSTQTLNLTPPDINFNVPTTPQQVTPIQAYADDEITGGWVGFQYFQVNAVATSATYRVCQAVSAGNCTTWANSGSGSGLPACPGNPQCGTAATGITVQPTADVVPFTAKAFSGGVSDVADFVNASGVKSGWFDSAGGFHLAGSFFFAGNTLDLGSSTSAPPSQLNVHGGNTSALPGCMSLLNNGDVIASFLCGTATSGRVQMFSAASTTETVSNFLMIPSRPFAHNGAYAILGADFGNTLTFTSGSPATWTIGQAGGGTSSTLLASFGPGWYAYLCQAVGSTGPLTVTATTSTFYGAVATGSASLTVPVGGCYKITADNAFNYFVMPYLASGSTPTLDAVLNPLNNASFAFPPTEGLTLTGSTPVAASTGTAAGSLFQATAPTGGNANGTNAQGGAGGTLAFTTGAGGASTGTSANSSGGNFTINLGATGTGGSGAAGNSGQFNLQIAGGANGYFRMDQNAGVHINNIGFQVDGSASAIFSPTVQFVKNWYLQESAAPSGQAGNYFNFADPTTHTQSINSNNNGTSSFTGAWTCTNVTPVTINANVTTAQNLMACTIPAGVLNRVGRSLRIHVKGTYTTPAAATPLITLAAKICSVSGCATGNVATLVTIQSTATLASVTNNTFLLDAISTTQTGGAASRAEASGDFVIDLGSLTTSPDTIFADTNTATIAGSPSDIDYTAQNFLQITLTFSTNQAGADSATERQLVAETIN